LNEIDPNKIAVEFVNKNIEKIIMSGLGVFSGAKNKIKLKMHRTYTDYLKKITERYSKSKSFFIRDEPVFIGKFYTPLSLSLNDKSIGAAKISYFTGAQKKFVLVGTAGSGKSILMKYLLTDCLTSTLLIPVFIELRELNHSKINLINLIKQLLIDNGLDLENDYLEKSLELGHYIFFLDGFDELDNDLREKVKKDINSIEINYVNNIFIISSRPDNEFAGWKDYHTLTVNNLTLLEAVDLVGKLSFDEELKNKFIKDLKDRLFKNHVSFLSNPLHLSIMLLTYGQSADIPNKLCIFYNQAYEALFQKHDTLKGGFKRKRVCKLDILEYAQVFSAFCIQTYDKQELRFSNIDALKYLDQTHSMLNI
jgi:predicted NACHT family NTPase